MKTHIQKLKALGACQEAVKWADNYPDMKAVWDNCERGDWLLWLLGRLSGAPNSAKRKQVVFIAAQCAREVLPIYEKRYPSDKRVRECIEACEAYSRGEITASELRVKRTYAAAAFATAAAYDAAYAACATAAAAYDADAAAFATCAHKHMQKRCAEIVRAHHPNAPTWR